MTESVPSVLPAHQSSDLWLDWLGKRRFGGDAVYAARVRDEVNHVRDRVIAAARLGPGMTIVDVGSGDGLVAFEAIARAGVSARVVFTDISKPLLELCKRRADELGVTGQCEFLNVSAERLDGIATASADVVTCRAVLAYVDDKERAMGEFFRVLRPGGRVSIAEPVMQDQALEAVALTNAVHRELTATDSDLLALLQRWKSAQFPSTESALRASPIANYNERDVVRWARSAGFTTIEGHLHIDVRPSAVRSWPLLLAIAPHPWAPTLEEILATRFSDEERLWFEAIVRPLIEAGKWTDIVTVMYLIATKPA